MATLDPRRRPHHRPTARMSIIELRAARGWSVAETARVFLVKPATIASWWKRVDEEGESPFVQTQTPVNKFPDFVRYIVCRLKVLHPTLGKKRIAQLLARAGLHIGVTTVKRMLEQGSTEPPAGNGDQVLDPTQKRPNKPVKSTCLDHVWQIDFTLVPTSAGFWVPWLPHTVPQCWPFCWWVECVVDHFSRRVVGFAVFEKQPTSVDERSFLGRVIAKCGRSPRYIVSDLGTQFDNDGYRSWCERRSIQYRYSSSGSLAATAVIERFFRSLKVEMLCCGHVPFRRDDLRAVLVSYTVWFNEYRPHQGLCGRTPNEVFFGQNPANEKKRIEPRARWPRSSPCALPPAGQRGRSGRVVDLVVSDGLTPLMEKHNDSTPWHQGCDTEWLERPLQDTKLARVQCSPETARLHNAMVLAGSD